MILNPDYNIQIFTLIDVIQRLGSTFHLVNASRDFHTQLGRFNELLKDAIDINGIIAPGRNGIWGRKWRELGYGGVVRDEEEEAGVNVTDKRGVGDGEFKRTKMRRQAKL